MISADHQPEPIDRRLAVRKAVIPAAGMGTRFLPATKSMPKEMLPIVDKPVLQFVIEEAVASGIDDILIVTGRAKRAIENHFDFNPRWKPFWFRLASTNSSIRSGTSEAVRGSITSDRSCSSAWGMPSALGGTMSGTSRLPCCWRHDHRATAKPAAGASPAPGCLRGATGKRCCGSSGSAGMGYPIRVVDGVPEEGNPDVFRLRRLVEKPAVAEAPSNLAIAGRYVFTPEIFECIDATGQGVGGEIQLTDAMNLLAQRQPMYALSWQASRYDIGNRVEYAKCFIDFAYAGRRPPKPCASISARSLQTRRLACAQPPHPPPAGREGCTNSPPANDLARPKNRR